MHSVSFPQDHTRISKYSNLLLHAWTQKRIPGILHLHRFSSMIYKVHTEKHPLLFWPKNLKYSMITETKKKNTTIESKNIKKNVGLLEIWGD
jgi:hypothetical protein